MAANEAHPGVQGGYAGMARSYVQCGFSQSLQLQAALLAFFEILIDQCDQCVECLLFALAIGA